MGASAPVVTNQLAGEVGIEPTNAGIKIRCLTTWRLPNKLSEAILYSYLLKLALLLS